jgi:O-antigen/teichoic acid export membrane protein
MKLENRDSSKLLGLFCIMLAITAAGIYGLQQPVGALTANSLTIFQNNRNSNPSASEQLPFLLISDVDNLHLDAALTLDPVINLTIKTSIEFSALSFSTTDYKGVIIEDIAFSSTDRAKIRTYFQNGGGIFILMGPNLHKEPSLLLELGLLTSTELGLPGEGDTGVLIENNELSDAIVANIEWNSSPEAQDFSIILPESDVSILVNAQFANKTKVPILLEKENAAGSNSILLTSLYLLPGYSKQIFVWFYFNYFIFSALHEIIGESIPTYSDWPYSPVPHAPQRWLIGILEATFIFLAVFFFTRAYKKSKRQSQEEYLKEFAEKMRLEEEKRKAKEKEEEVKKSPEKELLASWEQVGTHRQLSGFLFGFFAGFLLLIPQIVLTGFVFPRYIMPYPAIAGMYDWAKNFFQALWVAFDLGTSVALAKYFAQYRIDDPKRAIRYVQIFIWWQMITGCIQTSLVAFLGSFLFPQTYLAHMSYLFIFNSLIQFPGWMMVLVFVFQGMQRTDYQLIGNILQTAVFDLCAKYGFILLFRAVFSQMPQYGDAFGAMLGYSLGQWMGEFLTFLVTLKLFKKLGFHQSTLFRVDFTKVELMEVVNYGYKYVIGAILVPIVHMIQAILLSLWIYNYNSEWGYFSMIYTLTQINALVNLYSQGLMSGISEAHSQKAQNLLRLNLIQGFKISNYMSFFLISALAVVAGPFVVGAMGPDWQGAVIYVPFLLFRTIFEPATWLGDKVFQGTGYTKEMSISWFIEQGSRLFFLIVLMIPFQMIGLLMAWIISLMLKVLYQWIVIQRKVIRFQWYFWKTFGASGVAAIINAILMYGFTKLIFRNDALTAILLFVSAFFIFLPIYSFLTGWLGGWDPNTLREFDKASGMVTGVRIFARELYRAAELGAKHSILGLHERNIIEIYDTAIQEASELTARKQTLII